MISEIRIQEKADLGVILAQDDEAIFIPSRLVGDAVHLMLLATDGIPFTADLEYLQVVNCEDGLTFFDGQEAIFCENYKLGKLAKAVIA
jgi:hypothetical protein